MTERILDLYTVQIVVDPEGPETDFTFTYLRGLMAETEENLTDLLPAGYRARIRRWDDLTDEPTQEDEDA